MKPERRSPAPEITVVADTEQALREENERLRAEVAYPKKLQALIRDHRSIAWFNGKASQPQVRAAFDGKDGTACIDSGEEALTGNFRYQRYKSSQRLATQF